MHPLLESYEGQVELRELDISRHTRPSMQEPFCECKFSPLHSFQRKHRWSFKVLFAL